MSDLKRLWIMLFSCFVSMVNIKGYEESGVLLLVPSGGRYDPNDLWNADINTLVGVNDCQDDEILSVTDLALKGTYRNSRMLNLTYYEPVKIQFFVYDQSGNELLRVEQCPLADPLACTYGARTLERGVIAVGDGFRLFNGTDAAVVVFNPRRYFDDAPNEIKIFITSSPSLETIPHTGFHGCYTKPSGTADATQLDMTIVKCLDRCPSSAYFVISDTNCYCLNDISSLTSEEISKCDTLCPGESEQICGGSTTASVYQTTNFLEFRTFFAGIVNASEQVDSAIMTDDGAQQTVTLASETYVSAARVVVEEECQLTNLYFDSPPVTFNLRYDGDCGGTNPQFHTTLDGTGELEYFGSVKAKCVYLEPETFNYTYPRAEIQLYKASGGLVEVSGMLVVMGTWTIPDESTVLPSTTIDMFSSESIEISSSDDFLMPSTMLNEMSTEVVSPTESTLEMSESTIEMFDSTLSASEPLAATTGISPSSEATIAATGSTISASASQSTSSVSPNPGSGTTTPANPVATTTTKKIYTKDGRLIFEACTCVCKLPKLTGDQTRLEQAQEKGQELSEELQVNTKNLSATVRKKESAKDQRTSASAGGYAAIVLLSLIGVLFIAADAISIAGHVSMLKENLSSAFGK